MIYKNAINLLCTFSLFVYGLQYPTYYILLILPLALIFCFLNYKQFIHKDMIRVVVLLLFLFSYVAIGNVYGLVEWSFLYTASIMIVLIYIYAIFSPLNIRVSIFSLVYGFIVFVALSTYLTSRVEPLLIINSRKILNAWTFGIHNSPLFGVFLSFGLCLFISSVFLNKNIMLRMLISLPLFILSVFCLIKFQSRGPFLVFAIITLMSVVKFRKYLVLNNNRLTVYFMLFLSFLYFVSNFIIANYSELGIDVYTDRLQEQGFESDRFRTWMIGVKSIFFSPLGGREIALNNNLTGYIHNAYLDISYISGVVPLIFLVLFYFLHIKEIKFFFNSNINVDYKVLMFIFGLCSFINLLYEPVLQGSPVFFTLHIYFLGLILNHNRRGEHDF